MATTTAAISISSDITDSPISISNSTELYTAGTDTGISETTGLGRKKVATASNVVLLKVSGDSFDTAADVTADKSAKVYIKNMNDRDDGTKYVNILLATVEIGRLYGGDWMFIPWCAASGKDIEFTASDATETTLEYTCFYE
jgi:hypothetical protein